MSYTINFSTSTKSAIVVSTGTNDDSTSVNLVGKNYIGYGELIATNFLHLLENSASPIPPSNPVEGQLWYDTTDSSNKMLKVSVGSGSEWNTLGLNTRAVLTATTITLASGSTATTEISAYHSYALSKVQTSCEARVRLYVDEYSRTSDLSRSTTTAALSNIGLITEIITTSGFLTKVISPAVIGCNNDDPMTNQIYLSVTNNSAVTQPVDVILTLLKLES